MIGDVHFASSQDKYTVQSALCLHNCNGVEVCTQNVAEFRKEVGKQFDEDIYGPDCAKELEQKREEIETTGVLTRIIDEMAFLDCLYQRRMYVHCTTRHHLFYHE